MANTGRDGTDSHSEGTLDQFLLDEPWKPVDYLNEDEGYGNVVLSGNGQDASESTNYSNLFQININSIQSDIQKIRSASIDHDETSLPTHSVYGISEVDEDSLQNYVQEDAEEHLKVLDSTSTINNKSIEGDLEKLRRFQMSSIDEADEYDTQHFGGESDILAEKKSKEELKEDENDSLQARDEEKDSDFAEGKDVDDVLDLLPDLDEVLQDDDKLCTNNDAHSQNEESDIGSLNDLEMLETLNLPDVPEEQPHVIESSSVSENVDGACIDPQIQEGNEISLVPQDSYCTQGCESSISTNLEPDSYSPSESISTSTMPETSDDIEESQKEASDACSTGGDMIEGTSTDLLDLCNTAASTPDLLSCDTKGALESQNMENISTMIEIEGSLQRRDLEEDQLANDREVTSALIADLLLAEEELMQYGSCTDALDNVNAEASNNYHHDTIVGTGNPVCSNPYDQEGEPTTAVQITNTKTIDSDMASMEIREEEAPSPQTEGGHEDRRAYTVTSSGSEDLEEFIQDQYSNEAGGAELIGESAISGDGVEAAQETNCSDRQLGIVPPKWVPDKEARCCMLCQSKFTVVKRRHHCRACGKVLCATCCNMKFNLPYMSFKPARVCQVCCDTMIRAQNALPLPAIPPISSRVQAVPTIPELYDSDGNASPSPQQQSLLPPSGESPPSYQQSTTTFQGPLVPGNGMRASAGPLTQNFYPANRNSNRLRTESEVSAVIMFNSTQTNLPPVIRESNGAIKIVNSPDIGGLFTQMHDKDRPPVVFLVNKNLIVRVKIVHLDCCIGKVCWCFCTDGMGASNQEEIVLVNEYYGDDVSAIKCVLQQLNAIFEKAKQGNSVGDLGCITFSDQMLLNPNLTSMMFFKSTLQCTQNLVKPSSPFLFGQYLHANEVSWGKVFPMRVFLRLGLEYKSYPCPIYNDLNREVLYSSGGRTIVNLLADLRNFQYSIQKITGVLVMLKNKDTILKLPQNRYDEVLKLVNTAEDHVLCFGGNFTNKTDSYMVAVEGDSGFTTQTVHISKKSRKVTLASFLVFSASLKPSQEDGVAKTNIVEDGIMVQITADLMKVIRSAIKDMKDHSVICGAPDSNDGKLIIEWTSGEPSERSRHKSPIDGLSLDNLTNMKIRHSYDYASSTNPCKIHWMEVYFLPNDGNTVDRLSARELGQMTSSVAKACMEALRPHLGTLCELKMSWIGLRISLDADSVEYKIGSNLQKLPDELTADLDDKLIPAIHGVMSSLPQGKIQVELIFQVVRIV